MQTSQVYLNGQFLPRDQARLDIEDRGTLFGDGVYEVIRYYGGRPLTLQEHLDRLRQSAAMVDLPLPADVDRLEAITGELVQRHGLGDARVYWQVTRGISSPRDHVFAAPPQPTLLVTVNPAQPLPSPQSPAPQVTAILEDDLRWHRCCVKSLMLLPNVLAKNKAKQAGCFEAILHRDGRVTEGCSSNVLIVRNGQILTHPADHWILNGITRQLVIKLAREQGLEVIEQPFTVDVLKQADEVMVTGTTTHVACVTHLDGQPIGNGQAGPVGQQLHQAFLTHTANVCHLTVPA